jgi:hypothetical protein
MPIRSLRTLLHLLACVAVVACGDSRTAPELGSIILRLTTTGKRPDPDGFMVSVDGGTPQAVPANGTLQFQGVSPGTHTLAVGGAMWNCRLSATSVNVQAVPATEVNVSLTAHCPRILSNELLLATQEYGFSEGFARNAEKPRSVEVIH